MKITTVPATPQIKACLALATSSGFPCAVKNINADTVNNIITTITTIGQIKLIITSISWITERSASDAGGSPGLKPAKPITGNTNKVANTENKTNFLFILLSDTNLLITH